jgi:hypothetical protein
MENDNTEGAEGEEAEKPKERAPRARNRTVMLTPDITGQVRARLGEENGAPLPDGFHSPQSTGLGTGRPLALPAETPRPNVITAPTPQPTPSYSEPQSGWASPARGETPYAAPSTPLSSGLIPMQTHRPPAAPLQYEEPVHVAPPSVPLREQSEGSYYVKESPIVGFLVSFDVNPNGDVFELRVGRLVVTSDHASGGSYILVRDETVSPMHAIVRVSPSGEIQVLDQLSEYGTKIKRFGSDLEEELSGDKSVLQHGDLVKFGERAFLVCLLAAER